MSTDIGGDGFDGDVEVGGDFAKEEVAAPVKETEEVAEEVALELTEDDEIVEDKEEGEKPEKKPKTAKERIQELNARLRDAERALDRERVKNELRAEMGLQPEQIERNNQVTRVAPDPTDLSKYPLGALDDRYVEDKIAFGIESALGSVQQRQLEDARVQAEQAEQVALLKRADEVVQKGTELYEDFHETVWEAGQRNEYAMDKPTFDALLEAEHGADVAYFLATNKTEAARVAAMSPNQQVFYVATKNAEFAAKRKPRLPKASTPPAHQSRGTSGKFSVAPDTDDLEAFSRELFQR